MQKEKIKKIINRATLQYGPTVQNSAELCDIIASKISEGFGLSEDITITESLSDIMIDEFINMGTDPITIPEMCDTLTLAVSNYIDLTLAIKSEATDLGKLMFSIFNSPLLFSEFRF